MFKQPEPVNSVAANTDTLGKTLLSVSLMDTNENTLCSQTEILTLDSDVTVKVTVVISNVKVYRF